MARLTEEQKKALDVGFDMSEALDVLTNHIRCHGDPAVNHRAVLRYAECAGREYEAATEAVYRVEEAEEDAEAAAAAEAAAKQTMRRNPRRRSIRRRNAKAVR